MADQRPQGKTNAAGGRSPKAGGRKAKAAKLVETTGLRPDELIGLLQRMMLIREFEEECARLYRAGRIRGVTHTYQGQEAVAVGVCSTLNVSDFITSTHRGHAHVIAKGGDVNLMMAELLGKATGYCKGRGGSMHIADMSQGILGANGIVGGGMGIAVGAALSSKMLGRDTVAVCFFGDGAMNQGILHEVSNIAACWNLPVVFLCENNFYGMSASVEDTLACKEMNLAGRAAAYDIPAATCDGMDVIDVHLATRAAVERARGGGGPSYVVCTTYRFLGHHVGDPLTYRDKSAVDPWRLRDPIPNFAGRLVADNLATREQVDRWEAEAKDAIARALAFAEESPDPDPSNLTEDVFA
ncbi:MAG: thiamine pyrophosphate-dependent dehydrogenase E1 component subunit alpha [Thermoleophilia bacterium]|nr:thiamine pyrophosphate-dependent dehydrogenase E1 component subunit alpha [Thermoleophilia bacterium]